MANEAGVVIVARMRDEASAKLKNMGGQLQATQQQTLQFNLMLTTLGATLSAVGGLLGQIDSPIAKVGQRFLMIAAAVTLTMSSAVQLMPVIRSLIVVLRQWAIAQAFGMALLGPVGWITLAASLAVAGAAAAGIYAATGGFSRQQAAPSPPPIPSRAMPEGGVTNVTIQAGALMGNEQEARAFARAIQRFSREDTRAGR